MVLPMIGNKSYIQLASMSVAEKLSHVMASHDGAVPIHLQLLVQLLDRGLSIELAPSFACKPSTTTYPVIAQFSDMLRDYGGNTLLGLTRRHLPLDSIRACRSRAPLPIAQSGTLPWSVAVLLRLIVGHGPAVDCSRRGLEFYGDGSLVYVYLVESTDGVSLTRALDFNQAGNVVTGFEHTPTEEQLRALANMTAEEVNAFIDTNPMNGTAIVTMLSGVSGTASAPAMVSYRKTLGSAEDIAESRVPLVEALKKCASCLESDCPCIRHCDFCRTVGACCVSCRSRLPPAIWPISATTNRPCDACIDSKRICIVGRVVATVDDDKSGEIVVLWGIDLTKVHPPLAE